MTEDQIRRELRRFRAIHEKQDDLLVAAHEAGLPLREIARLSGLHRTTIMRVIRKQKGETSGTTE